MELHFKAVLFDFDGVVVDTEPQYTDFWTVINRKYLPEVKDFALTLKGNTLVEVFDRYFPSQRDRDEVRQRLNDFQKTMTYPYIAGFREFLEALRASGIKTAVATSSDRAKMNLVYKAVPEIKTMFDRIFTAEDYRESKPSPDCYITAARSFGFEPGECVVVEDSINGLKAAATSGSFVVGLTTTNPASEVGKYANVCLPDFRQVSPQDVDNLFCRQQVK